LSLTGADFVSGSVVRWNGADRPTTALSGTRLTASISARDIADGGIFEVAVFNPAPGGGLSNPLSVTVENPAPFIDDHSPLFVGAGGPDFTLSVFSFYAFVPSSVVRWNGSDRPTTFVSAQQLDAAIPASDIATPGFADITAFTPPPGGGVSEPVLIEIVPLPPNDDFADALAISTLPFTHTVDTRFATAESTDPTPTCDNPSRPSVWYRFTPSTSFIVAANSFGSTYAANMSVWIGSPGSFTEIACSGKGEISFDATAGTTYYFKVTNQYSYVAGGTLVFNVPAPNPIPSIASLSPSSIEAVSPGFTLAVNGSDFVPGLRVRWDGSDRNTVFVNSTQALASVSANDIAFSGTHQVTVFNPPPSTGTSNAITFTVTNPPPVISSISPDSASAGGAAFFLTINGTGFDPSSVLRWTDSDRPATYVSSGLLETSIPAGDIVAPGIATLTVFNPAPGGGTSNAFTCTINDLPPTNPVPAIGSLSPSGITAGGSDFGLTINGTGFIPDSEVRWNGADRTTNPVRSTQVRATIPASDIAIPGGAQVTVFNPAPGGGTSNAAELIMRDRPQIIERASVAGAAAEGNNESARTSLSADGRFVAFWSRASNLVPGDTNGVSDIFVRDTCLGASDCAPSTIRVSVASESTQADEDSDGFSLSPDGRFVAFESFATNLVRDDTNVLEDVFVHDTCLGAPAGCSPSTFRVSVASDGTQADDESFSPSLSATGRFVAFVSWASNLVADDTAGTPDLFVRDTCLGAPAGCTPSYFRVPGGAQPSLSADGRIVAFRSGDEIFVQDTCLGVLAGCSPSTVMASVASDGTRANSRSFTPSLSANGRFVAFESWATNLAAGDAFGNTDVFARDTCLGAPTGCAPSTIWVSVPYDGIATSSSGSFSASLSADGRFIAFGSWTTDLVAGDTNGVSDVFVRDTCLGAPAGCSPYTVRVSVASDAIQANRDSFSPSLSADARFLAFWSFATNLVAGDTNGVRDVFLSRTGVGNPAPTVTALSPASVTAASAAFTLTVSGTGFVSTAGVRWNGSDRATRFVSSKELQASIPSADIATAGTAQITVINPAPGGGTSNGVQFQTVACGDGALDPGETCDAGALSGTPASCCAANCTIVPDGTACSDGNVCTEGDQCQVGACAPGTAVAPPGEISNAAFAADGSTLTWDAIPNAPTGTLYDVARGLVSELPVGSGASETCMASGISPQAASDFALPGPGQASWYLVRGRHLCGTGTYGYAAVDGVPTVERITQTCP
jgi:hypothetical protein